MVQILSIHSTPFFSERSKNNFERAFYSGPFFHKAANKSDRVIALERVFIPLNPFLPSVPLGTLVISIDQDQTPQNAASDRGLHCLHIKYRNFYKTR